MNRQATMGTRRYATGLNLRSAQVSKGQIVARRPLLLLCGLLGLGTTASALATVTTFTYDAGNHVTSVTDPRGLVTAYAYDGLGLLWGQSSPDTGTTTFTYDSYGRRYSMTRADNTQTTYGYDSLNRMTSVSAGGQTQSLTYDTCTTSSAANPISH